ncbi:MAG: LysR family transcriptional regulator, partial [Sneathiella sp.]|nr:LysR family transcriptional regulator [Sneathiella sp.]
MYHSQLRAFHAVATQGGFSKAASFLGLTQPALSDQVKKLEQRFGVLLFHRHKRIVRMTELGEQLLEITHRRFELDKQ